ncbi:FMN-binding protein [Lachnospiraceae bacterium 54-53]
MRQKTAVLSFALIFMLTVLSGCKGGSDNAVLKDGTYSGMSSEDDKGAYGEATVTVADGKITDCEYVTWQKDGTVKDENYGKVNGDISNQDYYDKAQLAVKAMDQYAKQLVKVRKPEDVDAVSGATVSYDQFREAVDDALDKARE